MLDVGKPSVAVDDDILRSISLVYAKNHGNQMKSCASDTFKDGITNGAEWYSAYGSMQDYNYQFSGSLAITFEISCCKHPPAKDLDAFWTQNRDAMIRFSSQARYGVRGFVVDSRTNQLLAGVQLHVADRGSVAFNTTASGEYWRILKPGNYVLQAKKAGYANKDVPFTVTPTSALVLNVSMDPSAQQVVFRPAPFKSITPLFANFRPTGGNGQLASLTMVELPIEG